MYLHKHWNVFTLIEELVNWLQKQTRRFCAACFILGTSLLLIQFFIGGLYQLFTNNKSQLLLNKATCLVKHRHK